MTFKAKTVVVKFVPKTNKKVTYVFHSALNHVHLPLASQCTRFPLQFSRTSGLFNIQILAVYAIQYLTAYLNRTSG